MPRGFPKATVVQFERIGFFKLDSKKDMSFISM